MVKSLVTLIQHMVASTLETDKKRTNNAEVVMIVKEMIDTVVLPELFIWERAYEYIYMEILLKGEDEKPLQDNLAKYKKSMKRYKRIQQV